MMMLTALRHIMSSKLYGHILLCTTMPTMLYRQSACGRQLQQKHDMVWQLDWPLTFIHGIEPFGMKHKNIGNFLDFDPIIRNRESEREKQCTHGKRVHTHFSAFSGLNKSQWISTSYSLTKDQWHLHPIHIHPIELSALFHHRGAQSMIYWGWHSLDTTISPTPCLSELLAMGWIPCKR